jgi:hypothetical protein
MDDKSQAALDLLVQNGYLEIVGGKYRATKKLNSKETLLDGAVMGIDGKTFSGSWEDIYTKFITDCKIPRLGESGTGDMYELNKYSTDAMKHFRDLLKTGIQYALMVKVTTAYYKGSNRYKKKIGNYITEGLWRMDYETMKNQTETQQQQHLNEQLNSAQPFTRDRIG